MGAREIVIVTDSTSREESRPKLVAAGELLTGTAPVTIDARHFLTGGSGRATIARGQLRLEVPSENLVVAPEVVIIYEIPPVDRRRFEGFLRTVRQSDAVAVNADPDAWRTATEKDRTVRRFRRDGIRHMETITLRRPSAAVAIDAFERLDRDVWARPVIGSGGDDVFHLTTPEQVDRALGHYATASTDWMMSRDARNFKGGGRHQFRVFVLHDRILRACEHLQNDAEAPCNEAQGAISTLVPVEGLPDAVGQLAIAATRSLGLQFGGVDLAIENGGVVFEVNVHPVVPSSGGFGTVAIPFVEAHLDAIRQPGTLVR